MAEVAAGAFLSSLFQFLFERMDSLEIVHFFKSQKLHHGLLKKLKVTMITVNGLLVQAEEKQIIMPAVKRWLNELKDAVYEDDDLLDDIAYEAPGSKLEVGSSRKKNFQKKNSGSKRKFSEAAGNSTSYGSNSKSKKGRTCYNCGKKGHYKRECRFLKKHKKEDTNNSAQNSNKANIVEQTTELIAMISDLHIGMVTELNMATTTKSNDWWYDSGATVHVCNDKTQFKNYEEVVNGQKVLMGNHDSAKVVGKGSVELNFTSGKKLLLVNVLYVPEIRKNLVSASLLCKKGYKAVLESDKIIVSINGLFVGKGGGSLGKTTLAQLVYNEKIVEKWFDLKAWVCVLEEFDVSKIMKDILKEVTGENYDAKNELCSELKEKLEGKKFLLVMDDVWNDKPSDWAILRESLQTQAAGSKIVITTRNGSTSLVVHDQSILYHLNNLMMMLAGTCLQNMPLVMEIPVLIQI
ncbi:hypothetical protein GH714_034246 [Hevea brasiliensis]|uniref:CCHC-type domain-containing protein n=1 Tax=Hevea brasiliensis TaxID=3981 RepID=A0A6A6NE99_HEVBR|nr:hypothetical protein GH714_034246 [Hevea brasiliensis]